MKDWTDTESELNALIAFAKELGGVFHAAELIPYHELGKGKYNALRMEYPLEDMKPYPREDAVKVKQNLEEAGLSVTLAGI